MPPGNAGGLGAETHVNLVAFLLEANGVSAGSRPLTSETPFLMRSATGRMPESLQQALRLPAADQSTTPQISRPKGLTVTGEVTNYVPVTDQMLRNPDPGDW